MSRNIQQRQGKIAQQLQCALHLCRNLLVRHQTTLEFASRFLARITSPVAQRLQQPQRPTSVDGTTLFRRKTHWPDRARKRVGGWTCMIPGKFSSVRVAWLRNICPAASWLISFRQDLQPIRKSTCTYNEASDDWCDSLNKLTQPLAPP